MYKIAGNDINLEDTWMERTAIEFLNRISFLRETADYEDALRKQNNN